MILNERDISGANVIVGNKMTRFAFRYLNVYIVSS